MHLTCSYISLWGCTRAQRMNIRMRTHISRERCCQATRSPPPPAFSFHYIFVFCGCYQRWKEGKGSSKSSTSLFCCPCESMCCLIMFWCFLYYIVIILVTCSFFFLNMPISKPAQICCYLRLFRKWKQAFSFFLLSGSTPSVGKSHNWGSQLQPIISHLSLWSGTAQWAVRSQTST